MVLRNGTFATSLIKMDEKLDIVWINSYETVYISNLFISDSSLNQLYFAAEKDNTCQFFIVSPDTGNTNQAKAINSLTRCYRIAFSDDEKYLYVFGNTGTSLKIAMLNMPDLSAFASKGINQDSSATLFPYTTTSSQYMLQIGMTEPTLTFYHILGIDMNDNLNPTKWSKQLTCDSGCSVNDFSFTSAPMPNFNLSLNSASGSGDSSSHKTIIFSLNLLDGSLVDSFYESNHSDNSLNP